MFGCEDVDRIWDNPYDPRSDRSTWTPDNLTIDQISDNVIELNWVAIGKQADGFKIDRRKGNSDWIDTLGVVPYVSNQWRDFIDLKEQDNLKKIESLEKKLINNLDENSYSELVKLKSQLNRD